MCEVTTPSGINWCETAGILNEWGASPTGLPDNLDEIHAMTLGEFIELANAAAQQIYHADWQQFLDDLPGLVDPSDPSYQLIVDFITPFTQGDFSVFDNSLHQMEDWAYWNGSDITIGEYNEIIGAHPDNQLVIDEIFVRPPEFAEWDTQILEEEETIQLFPYETVTVHSPNIYVDDGTTYSSGNWSYAEDSGSLPGGTERTTSGGSGGFGEALSNTRESVQGGILSGISTWLKATGYGRVASVIDTIDKGLSVYDHSKKQMETVERGFDRIDDKDDITPDEIIKKFDDDSKELIHEQIPILSPFFKSLGISTSQSILNVSLHFGAVVEFSDHRDTYVGGEADNRIWLGGSDDLAYGAGGNDLLVGESGADWLYGGDGDDILIAGSGFGEYARPAGGEQAAAAAQALETPVDDFGENALTAGALNVSGTAEGSLEVAFDNDWFAVTLEAGFIYRFNLEGASTNTGTLTDPYLEGLYDPSDSLIALTMDDDGGTGLNSRLTFVAPATGTYHVSVGAFSDETGTYRLSASDGLTSIEDDFNETVATSGSVAVGASATGSIEVAFDRDWIAVILQAGTVYTIELEGEATGAGTLSDPLLQGIYSADELLITGTMDDDGGIGLNSRLEFTATNGGIHYISVESFGSWTGTYNLSIAANGVSDDYGNDVATAGSVVVTDPASGTIESVGDVDWFAVTLEAGQFYRVDIEGQSTGAGTLADPSLQGVYDPSGTHIVMSEDDDGGTGLNSRLEFLAHATGTYYIAATGNSDDTGTYRVSVVSIAGPSESEFGNLLVGGDGYDTAAYNASRADLGVNLLGDGTIMVQSGDAGIASHDAGQGSAFLAADTDTLVDIEKIELIDGSLLFDIDSPNLAFTYEIYAAGYGRTPDEGGLRFWTGIMDWFDANDPATDKSLYLASEFLKADEYVALYGADPSDYQYVDAMYQNVLKRLPDQSGYDFWVGGMQHGLGRDNILVAFAVSDENVVRTLPDISEGVWVA